MESQKFIASPESAKIDIYDEYAPRPLCVTVTIDDLDEAAKAQYIKATLPGRDVYVRNDVYKEIERRIASILISNKERDTYFGSGLGHRVHKVLRPILKKTYEENDKKRKILDEQTKAELLADIIKSTENNETRRIEIAEFVATFPVQVQKILKEGAFLIEAEGRYYPTVEEESDSFMKAEADNTFKSKKAGTWKKGLLQTLQAGSPYVRSFLASNISGVVNSFKGELRDDTVTAIVSGNSFSTFGDNKLFFYMQFKENGEDKETRHSFEPL